MTHTESLFHTFRVKEKGLEGKTEGGDYHPKCKEKGVTKEGDIFELILKLLSILFREVGGKRLETH